MKTLIEIKIQLELLKPILKEKFQVETIGIFGSYSQGQQKKKSDIDLLVTFTKSNDIDLLDFITLKQFLSRKLKTKVDLVEKEALKVRIKDRILQETIYIRQETPNCILRIFSKPLKKWKNSWGTSLLTISPKTPKIIRAITIIVIGEAAKHVPSETRKKYPQIPWSKLVGMRNILTHDYPGINVEIIWKTSNVYLY
jgi:hypothetical protein